MDDRFRLIAAVAASQYGAVSTAQISAHDVSTSLRSKWERTGLIERLGPRSFAVVGSTPTFERALTSGRFDLEPHGVVAGRAGARLYGLDGFTVGDAEFLVPRAERHRTTTGLVCASGRPLRGDTIMVKVQNGAVHVDNATVTKADVAASNGVIHVIDSVILPKGI